MSKMKHYIIVKFKEDINKSDLIAPINQLFKETLKIEGVDGYTVFESNSQLPNRFDLMIEITMSKQGLINFDKSDVHHNWKDTYGKYILNKTIFDCDIES